MNYSRWMATIFIPFASYAALADEIVKLSCTYMISYEANAIGTTVAEDSRFEINKTRNTVNGHRAEVGDGHYAWRPVVDRVIKENPNYPQLMIIHTRLGEFQHISKGEIIGWGKCRPVAK